MSVFFGQALRQNVHPIPPFPLVQPRQSPPPVCYESNKESILSCFVSSTPFFLRGTTSPPPPHTPHDQPIIPALLWFPSCVARPDDLQEIHLALELHRADGATYVEWIYLNIASMGWYIYFIESIENHWIDMDWYDWFKGNSTGHLAKKNQEIVVIKPPNVKVSCYGFPRTYSGKNGSNLPCPAKKCYINCWKKKNIPLILIVILIMFSFSPRDIMSGKHKEFTPEPS